jgi:hypothetical protein
MQDARDVERQRLREALRARLARVRGPMTDEVFDDLVKAVEETAERFAEIDRSFLRGIPDRRSL